MRKLAVSFIAFAFLFLLGGRGPINITGSGSTSGGSPAVLQGCLPGTSSGTSITIDAGSLSIVNGDLVFYLVGVGAGASSVTPVMTANGNDAWNTAHTNNAADPTAGHPLVGLFWHIADSDTTTAYRVDWTNASESRAWVCRVTGQGGTVEDQLTTATGDSNSIDAGATVGTAVLTLFMGLHDSGADTFVCPSIGGPVASCTADDAATGVDIGIAEGVNTGATGTVSFTSDGTDDEWRTITWSVNGT